MARYEIHETPQKNKQKVIPTCLYGVSELPVNPIVLVQCRDLQDRGPNGGRFIGDGVVNCAREVGDVVVCILHCHQDPSQVPVEWELLVLDLKSESAPQGMTIEIKSANDASKSSP